MAKRIETLWGTLEGVFADLLDKMWAELNKLVRGLVRIRYQANALSQLRISARIQQFAVLSTYIHLVSAYL